MCDRDNDPGVRGGLQATVARRVEEAPMVRKKEKPLRQRAAGGKSAAGRKKFHGAIGVESPREGDVIGDEDRVLVAIREVRFGDLPDPGKSEVLFVAAVETDKEGKDAASSTLKIDLIRYVRDQSALNIRDLVIYSGPVHRHLTIRCAITELDEKSIGAAKSVVTSGLQLAKDLAGPGSTGAFLGGLAPLVGSIFAFNKDDQIFLLNHSFYSAKVPASTQAGRGLRQGLYTFRKIGADGEQSGTPQGTLRLEVMAI